MIQIGPLSKLVKSSPCELGGWHNTANKPHMINVLTNFIHNLINKLQLKCLIEKIFEQQIIEFSTITICQSNMYDA